MKFLPGKTLSKEFYHECVQPIIERRFPQLSYTAGLLGPGSDVLGFDDQMSMDHEWGPRVQLFVEESCSTADRRQIVEALTADLPLRFRGLPTRFTIPDAGDQGSQQMDKEANAAAAHKVDVHDFPGYLDDYLGVRELTNLPPVLWLSLPQHKLLSIVSGVIFHDDVGIGRQIAAISYYPPQIRLYNLACCWQRIGQEEHLLGRAGYVGDDIGSSILAARIVRDVMRVAFHLERRYIPYPKWLGTGFNRLSCSSWLKPQLESCLRAHSWQERQERLCTALAETLRLQNADSSLPTVVRSCAGFHERPFQVIGGEQIAATLVGSLTDAELVRIAGKGLVGSIDLFSDNTDLLEITAWRRAVEKLLGD
jgi:hypothetical protein